MKSSRRPRIFLSYSKRDVEFVRRLEIDLRACQCEPWIDELEIPHGKPWLDEIFASGIPSCEILLCYITSNSIESRMVKQEIDVRLLERLQNNRVSLLMYADSDENRSKLRLDLQRLQIPVLNDTNYGTMLPKVVAAIWQSYAESFAAAAAQSEKVKRLEAEIRIKELEAASSKEIFTEKEVTDFSLILQLLSRELELKVSIVKKDNEVVGGLPVVGERTMPKPDNSQHHNVIVHVGSLFLAAIANQKYQPSKQAIYDAIELGVIQALELSTTEFEINFEFLLDFEIELLKYGLLERQPVPSEPSENRFATMLRTRFRVVFTPKFDRFTFWLDYGSRERAPAMPVVRLVQ